MLELASHLIHQPRGWTSGPRQPTPTLDMRVSSQVKELFYFRV